MSAPARRADRPIAATFVAEEAPCPIEDTSGVPNNASHSCIDVADDAAGLRSTSSGQLSPLPPSSVVSASMDLATSPQNQKHASMSSKGFLSKMREIGSAAVVLTRLQRINPTFSLDALRERGFDVVNLDKVLDRLPRFMHRVRGRVMLRELRAARRQDGALSSPSEQLKNLMSLQPTSSKELLFDLSRSTSVALFVGSVPLLPSPSLPLGSSAAVAETYIKLVVGEEDMFVLHFQHVQSWEMLSSGVAAMTFYPTPYDVRTPVLLELGDALLLSAVVQQMSRQHRIGMQLAQRITSQKFDIVHFNDVYHLEPFSHSVIPGVVGGASRFLSKLRSIQLHRNPLILFSGDFMSPSLQSVLMRGKHMIDAFNLIGVHFGTFGNHEFDYGMEALHDCIHGQVSGNFVFAGSNTKWISSNMVDGDGRPLCGALQYALTTWNGVRVGIVGLSENWLPSCNQLAPHEAHYLDVFSEGERLARMLKGQGASCVIALTHSRLQTDKELSARCPSIDLILGGHDHFYKCLPQHRLIKSGEEFEYLTEIEVSINDDGTVHVRTDAHPITYDMPADPAMEQIIGRYETRVQQRMGKVIGVTTVPLDCTESCCRFKEGLLPGFFCDVMEEQSKADFAVLGGAAIAGKAVMPPGDITLGDVFNWFPGDTRIMTIRVPGATVKKLLDVMVREVPEEAPSFPHPSSNLRFTINTMHTPATVQDILVKGVPLELEGWYTVAVEDFVGLGKAKYKFIPKEGEQLVDEECAEQITYWIIDYFEAKKKKRANSISPSATMIRSAIGMKSLVGHPNPGPLGEAGGQQPSMVSGLMLQGSRSGEHRGLATIANTSILRSRQKKRSGDTRNDRSGLLQSTRLDTPATSHALSSTQLLRIMDEVTMMGSEASASLNALSMALLEACERLVPCEVVRCFHHSAATGTSSCVAQLCRKVKPTRVAAHPRLGTYNHVRHTQALYHTLGDPREDPFFHRASEGHPRGGTITEMVTVPILNDDGFATSVQLVNLVRPLDEVGSLLLTTFASQVATLVLLAHQREVKEFAEALQKKVLEAAVELLGNQDISGVKLFDQLANVARLSRRIFDVRTADVLMIDYGTNETWNVLRTMTSKKSHEDVVVRRRVDDDFLVAQAVESGLPTLQDPQAVAFLREGLNESSTMASATTSADRTSVLVVPIFAPGAEDVLCVLRLENRRGNTFFTSHDEDAAINFSAFAAVAIQTGTEVEVLRTGVNRSQLKLFPQHELNRIKWKRGWGSVRSKLRVIVSEVFQAKLRGAECAEDPFMFDSDEPQISVNTPDA